MAALIANQRVQSRYAFVEQYRSKRVHAKPSINAIAFNLKAFEESGAQERHCKPTSCIRR
jgi:hypothetical protein